MCRQLWHIINLVHTLAPLSPLGPSCVIFCMATCKNYLFCIFVVLGKVHIARPNLLIFPGLKYSDVFHLPINVCFEA